MSSPSKTKSRPQKIRFRLVKTAVILAFVALAGRLVWVQGVLHAELQERADRRSAEPVTVESHRYRILDRNGLPLAENVQVYSCFADPSLIRDKSGTARFLAPHLGVDEASLRR